MRVAGDITSRTVTGITVLIICLILATLPTAVCAKNDLGNKLISDTAGQQKVITEADNGNTMYLKEGQTFILKLNENPSTGYSWQLSRDDGLNLLWDKYHPWESSEESGNIVIGAGGFHVWKIEAMNDGKVKATYKRPWEPETGREKTFTLNVIVA
ncbi:MAG: hypothetical protein EHM20_18255 [Alphaproteobacteria bacterium]|nr:MAG: hypothetical protein EHM20_18255 [Alphaproteobacteria bacterium]